MIGNTTAHKILFLLLILLPPAWGEGVRILGNNIIFPLVVVYTYTLIRVGEDVYFFFSPHLVLILAFSILCECVDHHPLEDVYFFFI